MNWLMNNRLCLHLMANKEKGFALPLAVLIGLILMVTGMTMIMRAQGDQSKVIAQKARADSLTSSEAGLARVQDLLNSVRVMATVDSNCTSGDCWQTAEVVANPSPGLQTDLKRLAIATACGDTSRDNEIANKILAPTGQRAENPGLRDLASGEWFQFQLNDNRYYRVVGYDYRIETGMGVLTLEGRSRKSAEKDLTNTDSNRDSGDNAASRNRVVVTIPINPSPALPFTRSTLPALWVSEGATENAGETAQITVSNAKYGVGAKFQGDVVMSDPTVFDEATATLRPKLECFISTDKIQQPTPAPNTPYKAQFVVGVTLPNLPAIPTASSLPSVQQGLVLTSSETFPRSGDTPSSSGVYEYIVNNINLSGSDKITITPGERVAFYVKGNINGAIEHDCSSVSPPTVCKPGNLQIYAHNDPTILGTAAPQICLRGNQRLEAFIFAKEYSLGKTDTGTFIGAAWGRNWGKISGCASPNNTVAVTQGVEWTDLIQPNLNPGPLNTLPQLGKIANWCEEPIDTAAGKSECD
jgi:hypothetical protein